MNICIHFCICVYISVYSHLSSKDAPRNLLQNECLESFCGGLWLGIRPFLFFVDFSLNWWMFRGIGWIFHWFLLELIDFSWNWLDFRWFPVCFLWNWWIFRGTGRFFVELMDFSWNCWFAHWLFVGMVVFSLIFNRSGVFVRGLVIAMVFLFVDVSSKWWFVPLIFVEIIFFRRFFIELADYYDFYWNWWTFRGFLNSIGKLFVDFSWNWWIFPDLL